MLCAHQRKYNVWYCTQGVGWNCHLNARTTRAREMPSLPMVIPMLVFNRKSHANATHHHLTCTFCDRVHRVHFKIFHLPSSSDGSIYSLYWTLCDIKVSVVYIYDWILTMSNRLAVKKFNVCCVDPFRWHRRKIERDAWFKILKV